MGKSMDLLEDLRSTMEGERELLFCLGVLESVGGGRETLGRKRMGINTPSAPTVT